MLSFDNLTVYKLIIEVGAIYAVDPSMSIASEEFFRALLADYKGDETPEQVRKWLDDEMASNFIVFDKRPEWIQSAEWPFRDGKPMIFVGQLDVRRSASDVTRRFIHDDTSYYLFTPQEKGPLEVVMQQY
jgi:hypothetical protein